jgi:hypothetical protein
MERGADSADPWNGYALAIALKLVASKTVRKRSKRPRNTMRDEYGPSQLKGGVRGKYYRRATAETNLVLIDADLVEFPNSNSVNRALRLLADTARVAAKSKRSNR